VSAYDPATARCTTCHAETGAPCVYVKGDRIGQPLAAGALGAFSSVGPVHSTRSTDAYLAAYRAGREGGPMLLAAVEKLTERLQRTTPRPYDIELAEQIMEWAHMYGELG
jgi:hypothetical protein